MKATFPFASGLALASVLKARMLMLNHYTEYLDENSLKSATAANTAALKAFVEGNSE
jgi:hypothetical protein